MPPVIYGHRVCTHTHTLAHESNFKKPFHFKKHATGCCYILVDTCQSPYSYAVS